MSDTTYHKLSVSADAPTLNTVATASSGNEVEGAATEIASSPDSSSASIPVATVAAGVAAEAVGVRAVPYEPFEMDTPHDQRRLSGLSKIFLCSLVIAWMITFFWLSFVIALCIPLAFLFTIPTLWWRHKNRQYASLDGVIRSFAGGFWPGGIGILIVQYALVRLMFAPWFQNQVGLNYLPLMIIGAYIVPLCVIIPEESLKYYLIARHMRAEANPKAILIFSNASALGLTVVQLCMSAYFPFILFALSFCSGLAALDMQFFNLSGNVTYFIFVLVCSCVMWATIHLLTAYYIGLRVVLRDFFQQPSNCCCCGSKWFSILFWPVLFRYTTPFVLISIYLVDPWSVGYSSIAFLLVFILFVRSVVRLSRQLPPNYEQVSVLG